MVVEGAFEIQEVHANACRAINGGFQAGNEYAVGTGHELERNRVVEVKL